MPPKSLHAFPSYATKFLKIITKNGQLIPFQLNLYQRRLIELIHTQRQAGKPVRILILKARQVGLSTLSCGYVYHKAATRFYQKSVLVAHDADSTSNLFDVVKRFYDLSPEQVRPLKRYSNKRELVFENPNDGDRTKEPGLLSKIEVDTAGSSTAGRSSTINHLHISELAFWPKAKETLSALLQALSSDPSSTCIIESTANGFDGIGREFYERVKASQEKVSDFEFFFIPWFEVDDYRLNYPVDHLTDKEESLRARFQLSKDQLAWRRWKIQNDFNGDEQLFCQEYPSSPEEAFIHSGRPVFNVESLLEHIQGLNGQSYQTAGLWKQFEAPRASEPYAIGADVAEGLESGDYSTAFIVDRHFNQVASLHCHLSPDRFAALLVETAKRYNNALLAPEINSLGYAVLSKIKDLGYTNIYKREGFEKQEVDLMQRLGWHTNVKTKALMLEEFKAAVRDRALLIKDVDLLREMTTLFYEADGSVTLNGKDRTVAACIALQALKQCPLELKYKATYMEDEDKQPKYETFQQRMARISKRGHRESYFT